MLSFFHIHGLNRLEHSHYVLPVESPVLTGWRERQHFVDQQLTTSLLGSHRKATTIFMKIDFQDDEMSDVRTFLEWTISWPRIIS